MTGNLSPARSSVSPHLTRLRWCGFINIPHSGLYSRLHDAYCFFSLSLTSLYLLQELIYAYQEREDMDELAQVMFLLLCHVTSLVKQLVFYLEADRINRLIEGLDDPLFNRTEDPNFRALLESRRVSSRRLVRVYSGTAIFTCMLWMMFPIVAKATGNEVRFHLHTAFDYNDSFFGYLLLMVYTNGITTLIGIANTTMDALIATFLAQGTTQLTILRACFQRLPEEVTFKQKETGENCEVLFREGFVKNIHHYNKVIQMTKEVEDIFGFAILVQFAIGGWILCMAAYRIVSLGGHSLEAASIILFIVCILTELFLYCYYGNELTVESSLLSSSLYLSRWEMSEHGARRFMLHLMLRVQRVVPVTAARFVPLSLSSFLTIVKSSYTFFTVLRQTK